MLLKERKKIDIGLEEYNDYYYAAFPLFMRGYGGTNLFIKKYKEGGFLCAVKEVIAHISKGK